MQLFEPFSIKGCPDVELEVRKVEQTYAFDSNMVSFDILQINTLYRGEKKKDFTLLEGEERDRILSNDQEYNRDDFEIRQLYDVKIRGLKDNDLAPFVFLKIDSECYELYLELKAGLEIRDDDEFFGELYEEIMRKKVLMRVIVRLFGDYVFDEIEHLRELFVQLGLKGKLESDRSFVVAKASGFIPSTEAHFRFILQEEWNKSHTESVEFASYAVKSGELVGIAFKDQAGSSGRNLLGEYISCKKQDVEHSLKIRYKKEEFHKVDNNGIAEYYADLDGYVSFGEDELRLISDFSFSEVSLRKNGSLLGGHLKGFVVDVTCSNPSQDAIGASVILEASDIKIYGSVAENSQIIGNKVEVNGQTHQSSVIRAKELSIDKHKGSAFGEKISINSLENGSVDGQDILVHEASGGTMRAEKLIIEKLYSRTTSYVACSVHIKEVKGGDNRVMITSRATTQIQESVAYTTGKIESNIAQINTLLGVLNKDIMHIRKIKPLIERIKVIMEDNKKNNKPNKPEITSNIAQYMLTLRRSKYFKERLLALQEDSKKLNAYLEELDVHTKDAKVTLESPWQKENEIVFESFFPASRDILFLDDGENVDIRIDKQTLKLVREARV